MKRKSIFGIITLVIFGSLLLIACENEQEEKNPFRGTWVSSEGYTAVFEESSWSIRQYAGGVGLKGTYTFTDNTARITYTEISNDGGVNWRPITSAEAARYVTTATVSGNRLTWGITTYTRQ